MQTLSKIYQNLRNAGHWCDKGDEHSYIEWYERELAPYRRTATSVLEIGVYQGGSLRMWREYFGGTTRIYGLDIAECRPVPGATILQGNSTSQNDCSRLFSGKAFNVIIDDGSHAIWDQLATFSLYSPMVRIGGLYVIEDVNAVCIAELESRGFKIVDRRGIKNRSDDVLSVWRPA